MDADIVSGFKTFQKQIADTICVYKDELDFTRSPQLPRGEKPTARAVFDFYERGPWGKIEKSLYRQLLLIVKTYEIIHFNILEEDDGVGRAGPGCLTMGRDFVSAFARFQLAMQNNGKAHSPVPSQPVLRGR